MLEQINNYSSFTVYDLLDDPQFVEWIFLPTPALDAYWQRAVDQYPNLSEPLTDARNLLINLKILETPFPKAGENRVWSQIMSIAATDQPTVRIISTKSRIVAAVAATVIGILFVFSLWYLNSSKSVATHFAETQSLILPDGSAVTLNANSTIKFKRYWNDNHVREVWLSGEAYFNVMHRQAGTKILAGDRFIVHAGRLNVEVLGTSFNVNDRHDLVNVALLTGKVSMYTGQTSHRALILHPGDVFEYQRHQDTIIHKKVKSTQKVAWKNKMLVFDHTPVSEVFTQLEDLYGYKVIVKDTLITKKRVSGSYNIASEANLLKALSLTLNVSIKKDSVKHQLIIQ
jgi:transmembrane sensor